MNENLQNQCPNCAKYNKYMEEVMTKLSGILLVKRSSCQNLNKLFLVVFFVDMEHKMENMHVNSEAQAVKIDAQAMKIADMHINSEAQEVKINAQAMKIADMHINSEAQEVKIDAQAMKIADMHIENTAQAVNISDMHIQMENMAKEQNGCKFANSVQTAVMQDQLTVLDAQIRKDRNQHFSELAALFATTRVLRFDLNATTNLSNEN